MAKKELRKLNRAELLQMLVEQTERAERLTSELAEAREQIRNREQLIRQAGELATSASKLIKMLEREALPAVNMSTIPDAQQPKKAAYDRVPQKKVINNETNGFDMSAIIAITSGIGKGKV